MLLAIDVGNTNIVFGVFKGKTLVKTWRVGTGDWGSGIRGKDKIADVIISSVVPRVNIPLKKAIEKKFKVKPAFIKYKDIDLKINLKKKAQVGADRLVNAFAARELYGKPVIIVDFGTATTFCAVNRKGEYLGGAIAPGVSLSAGALHTGTAKLPEIKVEYTKKAIGRDTVSAMQSGLYYGYVALVEGMIKRVKKEVGGTPIVVATGGFSEILKKHTKIFDVVDKNLTLKGLRMIWEGLNV